MNEENIQALRDQVARFYAKGAFNEANHCLQRLQVLGDQSKGWWGYALMLAAAMGDTTRVDSAIRILERDSATLLRCLKSAWSNAVSEKHWDLAKRLGYSLSHIAPDDINFRLLNLLDSLNEGDQENEELKRLMADPLPIGDLSPEVLRKLINALHRAGFTNDAGRMLDYLIRKHPPTEPALREETAILACQLKKFSLAMSLTADCNEPRHRYIYCMGCLKTLSWDELKRTQLSPAELQALLEDNPDWQPSMLWCTLMLPGYTNADHLALARRISSGMPTGTVMSHVRPIARPTRLRLGYLSGDFKVHPCAQLITAMLEAHDRSRFVLIAFDNSREDGSVERSRSLAAFDEIVVVRNVETELVAEAIQNAGVDILVDTSGHTNDNRVDVLALRPAPIQITWLGFPGGLGGALADYLVADGISVPDGMEKDFDEAVIRLPVSYLPGGECPSALEPPSRQSQGIPDDALVFACFNQQAKISGETFAEWCEILRAVPESVLWMIDENEICRKALMSAAAEHGVAPSRLYWAMRVKPQPRHVQRIGCADLILDSHPFTMHTTAVDALAAGVPFLTYCGETVASRVSASLLHTAGLSDCVCDNAVDYVRRMVALARNTPERLQLRARFQAARTESPLFDSQSFARYLETAYDIAYERWLAGEEPTAITVEPRLPTGRI